VARLRSSSFLPLRVAFYFSFLVRMYIYLWRNPDAVVISPGYFAMPFVGKRQMLLVHDLIQLRYPRSVLGFLAERLLVLPVAKRCGCVITSSEFSRKCLESMGIGAIVVYRMYDPHVLGRFREKITQMGTAGRADRYIATYIGTDAPHKNLDFFLKLVARMPHVMFAAIVPKRVARRLSTIGRSNLELFVEVDKSKYDCVLQHSKYLISPSLEEGFGPGLDGLVCGSGLALSDIEVYREIFDGIAVFFDPREVSTAVDALTYPVVLDDRCRAGMTALLSLMSRQPGTFRSIVDRWVCSLYA
jgi:glycosyltransferase involved in cell wall biosynthesis